MPIEINIPTLFREIADDYEAHPEHWTKGANIRWAGQERECWCANGALIRNGIQAGSRTGDTYLSCLRLLRRAMKNPLTAAVHEYNDLPTTTVTDVINMFRRAADLAEAA